MVLPLIAAGIGAGANLLGSYLQGERQSEMAERNIGLQREFAENAVSWKVRDAERAGVHPLFALGASTHSFSPVSVGGGIGEGLSRAGQDVSRAIMQGQTAQERQQTFGTAVADAQLEGEQLNNEYKRLQIMRVRQQLTAAVPGVTPDIIPGQSVDTVGGAGIKIDPLKVNPAAANAPYSEPGPVTDVGWARTATGVAPVPGGNVKERIEDVAPYEWSHAIRNLLLPTMGDRSSLPPFDPGPGNVWVWVPWRVEYQAVPKGSAREYLLNPNVFSGR
jgi:hypothetical protein